jgi:pimeloyl-ACP methyl ester carboxylesterase/DNA-binding CsgD family transcriptional regulator
MDAPPLRYVSTNDGYNLAYARVGHGSPLVFVPLNFSHVQLFWRSGSILAEWLRGLSDRFELILYDGRGQGMSTRGLSESFTALDQVTDLQTIVDHLGLEHFVLMARGPNAHAAIRYAAANASRVDALLLFSLPAHGGAWPRTFAQALPAENWKLFLQSFTAFDGRSPDPDESVDRMAKTVTQEDWTHFIRAWIASDVRDLLPTVTVPTLVVHPQNVIQPSMDESMNLAALVPNCRLVVISGSTQLGDPGEGLAAVETFVSSVTRASETRPIADFPVTSPVLLSAREIEVLKLLASGLSSREIGTSLTLSVRTVERHISNIYLKTGTHGRAQATAYAIAHRFA